MTSSALSVSPRATAVSERPGSSTWQQHLRWALLWCLGWRLLLSTWAGLVGPGLQASPFSTDDIFSANVAALPTSGPVSDFILAPWYRWDAGFYLKIATWGYSPDDGSTSFAPLYPALIWLLTPLALGNATLAALVLSTIACAAAVFLLLRYLTPDLGERAAKWAAVALLVFPTGYYLLSPFTEALFLSLALGALWTARRGWWWLAAGLALLAGFARFHGAGLALPLAVEWWRQHRAGGAPLRVKHLVSLAAAPAAGASFVLWSQSFATGGAVQQFATLFDQHIVLPWVTVWAALKFAVTGYPIAQDILNPIGLLLSVAVIGVTWRQLPPTYHAYAAGFLLITLATFVTVSPLRSYIRYVLMLFPAFAAVGVFFSRHPRVGFPVLCLSAVFQLAFLGFFTRWGWVA